MLYANAGPNLLMFFLFATANPLLPPPFPPLQTIDIPGLMTAGEYYPYVSFDVNLAPFYPSR